MNSIYNLHKDCLHVNPRGLAALILPLIPNSKRKMSLVNTKEYAFEIFYPPVRTKNTIAIQYSTTTEDLEFFLDNFSTLAIMENKLKLHN